MDAFASIQDQDIGQGEQEIRVELKCWSPFRDKKSHEGAGSNRRCSESLS